MTVKELIKALSGCPQDAEVLVLQDGNCVVGEVVSVRSEKDYTIIDAISYENRP